MFHFFLKMIISSSTQISSSVAAHGRNTAPLPLACICIATTGCWWHKTKRVQRCRELEKRKRSSSCSSQRASPRSWSFIVWPLAMLSWISHDAFRTSHVMIQFSVRFRVALIRHRSTLNQQLVPICRDDAMRCERASEDHGNGQPFRCQRRRT